MPYRATVLYGPITYSEANATDLLTILDVWP